MLTVNSKENIDISITYLSNIHVSLLATFFAILETSWGMDNSVDDQVSMP